MKLFVKFAISKNGKEYCALYVKKDLRYIALTFDRNTIIDVCGMGALMLAYSNYGSYCELCSSVSGITAPMPDTDRQPDIDDSLPF